MHTINDIIVCMTIFLEVNEMPIDWRPTIKDKHQPIYIALAESIETDINSGVLRPGDKLPPQRELADRLNINLSTITRAFRLCELKGLVHGIVGRGTFISSDATISLSLISGDKPSKIIEMGQVLPLYALDKDTAKQQKACCKIWTWKD